MPVTVGACYVGLMSGTSVDGVDAVVVEMDTQARPAILAARCLPMPPALRERILALSSPGDGEVDRLGVLDVELGRLFAGAALQVIADAGLQPRDVRAIGSHGQTVRHRAAHVATPFTLQIGDPNTIAELTGITTVADFRRRDIAAGGQGAPLVPAFHAAMFRLPDRDRVVANIGGMANLTVLPAAQGEAPVRGFDTGPGNVLMDAWHDLHRGSPVDHDGRWARGGRIDEALLDAMLADPFLATAPPKSTGREHFDLAWLQARLAGLGHPVAPRDVQATLVEFTARSVAEATLSWGTRSGDLFLCGGGAHNGFLRERLAAALPDHRVATTAELGIDPDMVEAMAFAWLASRTLAGLPGNLPAVTGASRPVVLGGIYPGRGDG